MLDADGSAADHLDDHLNRNSPWQPGDELPGFAQRVVRQAALPDDVPATLSEDQRDRIRRKLFGETPDHAPARTPMQATTTVTTWPTIQAHPTHQPKPSALSILMTAALVAIIGIAGVGLLRGSIDLLPDRNGAGPERAPGFLAQGTPAFESPDGCPLTSDMFLVSGDEPLSDDLTSVLPFTARVTADGNLIITCSGVDDPEPLLTGVTGAESLPWPGTVMLELDDGNAIVYNIATGQRADLGDFDRASGPLLTNVGSPWLATPNNEALTDWRITHLGTMESMILSEEIGGVLPRATYPEFAWSPGSPYAVVTRSASYGLSDILPPNAEDATIVELPDDALVLDDTFETRRWLDTRGEVAVSADGEAIAWQPDDDQLRLLRVEHAGTGETLAEFTGDDLNARTPAQFAFAGDGESLVYLDGDEVWVGDYTGEPTTTLVETGDMQPSELRVTGVPSRVLVRQDSDDNVDLPARGTAAEAVSIIDTGSGEVTDIEGLHFEHAFFQDNRPQDLEYIVTMSPAPESESTDVVMTVMHLVNIATGDVVLTSEPIEGSITMVLNRIPQAMPADNGALTLVDIQDGPSILFDVDAGVVGMISPPSVDEEEVTWIISLASDGDVLYAVAFQQSSGLAVQASSPTDLFTVAPVSIDPQWAVPSDNIPSVFIRGVQPQEPEEPATLDAQEMTPRPASPVATPAP